MLLEPLCVIDARARHRNEALDVVTEVDHHAAILQARNRAFRLDSSSEPLGNRRPRIIRELLDTETDALVLGVHVEDHHIELFAFADDLGRVLDPPGPAHVGHVDQTVDTCLDLYEGPERGQVPDDTRKLCTGRVLHRQRQPRILFDLLHPERDLLILRIDLEDHRLNVLSNGDDLGRVSDISRPGHLGDVHQSFDALLELDEGTVVRDRYDAPLHP